MFSTDPNQFGRQGLLFSRFLDESTEAQRSTRLTFTTFTYTVLSLATWEFREQLPTLSRFVMLRALFELDYCLLCLT